MPHRWYVVHAYSGFENKVAQSIREQAGKKGLSEEITDVIFNGTRTPAHGWCCNPWSASFTRRVSRSR